jgi:putative ABC transport system permease protein
VLSVTAASAVAAFVSIRVLRADAWKRMSDASIDVRRSKPSSVLVVVQVAAALVLLSGAGLLLNSFVRLTTQKLGFDASNVLTLQLTLPAARYRDARQQADFYAQAIESLGSIPGVDEAAAGTALPFQGTQIDMYPITIAGRRRPEPPAALMTTLVTPGYFRIFRVALLRGREFMAADGAGAPLAAVVSQSFVERYFRTTDPVGQQIRVANAPPSRIVGVVADFSHNLGRPSTASPSLPMVYFSARQLAAEAQRSVGSMTVVLRTAHDPFAVLPAIRSRLAALDPALPIYAVATVTQLMAEYRAESRLYSTGSVAFAAIALFLAIIGLYGVMAYSVGSRTQEWGIRMALGADAREILRHVVAGGLRLTVTGVACGTAGAWITSRSLRSLLFGVTPNDPATLVAVTALFVAVAMAACYLPARRASRVDPMVALRHE